MLLTEDQRQIRDAVREFVRERITPFAAQWARERTFPREALTGLAGLGCLGVAVPEQYGGAGLDYQALAIILEEIAAGDGATSTIVSVNNCPVCSILMAWGNDAQKARWLPPVARGELIGAFCLTEPHVGSEASGLRTTARRDGDHYVLNGRKTFITNGPEADVLCVYAKLDERITTFVVERGTPGFATGAKIPKMGMRASTMSELMFDECRLPAANLLGREGGGITNMMRNLEIERLGLAAMAVGIGQRCVDVMVRYSQERRSFGKPLHDLGQIQRYLGDSYAKLTAMRAMVYAVAATCGPDARNRLGTDAAKLFCATAAKEIADAAVQVLGGYGYCSEYRVEQFLRDAKLIEIGGGTLEAHQKNITRDLTAR